MYLHAENVTVDTDEGRFVLLIDSTEEDRITVDIHGIDLDTFYDQVKGRIGPYLREREETFAEFKAARARGEFHCVPDESGGLADLRRSEYDHERMTGQHADPYDVSDPKHEGFHSIHADLYDQREGK